MIMVGKAARVIVSPACVSEIVIQTAGVSVVESGAGITVRSCSH